MRSFALQISVALAIALIVVGGASGMEFVEASLNRLSGKLTWRGDEASPSGNIRQSGSTTKLSDGSQLGASASSKIDDSPVVLTPQEVWSGSTTPSSVNDGEAPYPRSPPASPSEMKSPKSFTDEDPLSFPSGTSQDELGESSSIGTGKVHLRGEFTEIGPRESSDKGTPPDLLIGRKSTVLDSNALRTKLEELVKEQVTILERVPEQSVLQSASATEEENIEHLLRSRQQMSQSAEQKRQHMSLCDLYRYGGMAAAVGVTGLIAMKICSSRK